jgi:hypothetical protein
VILTTTQRRIGLSVCVALFALAFFLIIFDHRDGTLRIVALVSFGFLGLTTAYRLIKELRSRPGEGGITGSRSTSG